MTTSLDDFEQQNLINRYRHRLDDIREWRAMLSDVMITVTGYSMDLANVRSTTDRIPGGDALTMRGPWARDADHGDDLPHPDQVLREWMETITEQPSPGTWGECWRWHRDQTQRILESPWADAWRTDIDALWWRLAKLTGNHPEPTPAPEITTDQVIDALRDNPDHPLTRREISIIFNIPASTITTWRSRGLQTDHRGHYRAGDILDRLTA